MIHAVSENGPWIDLDEIRAIESKSLRGCAEASVYVHLADGKNVQFFADVELVKGLAAAWIAHRDGDGESGDMESQPKSRTLS